jgi:hypothetical protein
MTHVIYYGLASSVTLDDKNYEVLQAAAVTADVVDVDGLSWTLYHAAISAIAHVEEAPPAPQPTVAPPLAPPLENTGNVT